MTPKLLATPKRNTNRAIPVRMASKGIQEGTKEVWNNNQESNRLVPRERIRPDTAPKRPKKAYSKAYNFRIWELLAPRGVKIALCLILWYLLLYMAPISTMAPTKMLKKAIKFMTQDIFSRISSISSKMRIRSRMETFGNFWTNSVCSLAEPSRSGTRVVKT